MNSLNTWITNNHWWFGLAEKFQGGLIDGT